MNGATLILLLLSSNAQPQGFGPTLIVPLVVGLPGEVDELRPTVVGLPGEPDWQRSIVAPL